VIPTQITRTPIPPIGDVREGASPSARTGAAGVVDPPEATPGRSNQMCTKCRRKRPVVTLEFGKYRSRLCSICMGRPDKTTEVTAVECAHRFSQPSADGQSRNCIDCFEPMPPTVERDVEHLRDCVLCREAGSARPGTILSVLFLAVVMLGVAGATGKLRSAVLALPLPEPALNGWPLGVLLIAGGGCWWRMMRAVTTPHEPDELTALRRLPRGTEPMPEPLAGATWPAPVELFPGDQVRRVRPAVPRRRTYPPVPFADLHPDVAELAPTLLPEGRVQS